MSELSNEELEDFLEYLDKLEIVDKCNSCVYNKVKVKGRNNYEIIVRSVLMDSQSQLAQTMLSY